MSQYTYLISSILILTIDSIYLNFFKSYFANQVQSIQKSQMTINISGVVLSYLFIIFGFNYFVLGFNMNLSDSFLLGLVIYGIYEATNLAIFKNWKILSVIIDTIWGGLLFLITNFIIKLIKLN
jgi:uncharacterized membrane protein